VARAGDSLSGIYPPLKRWRLSSAPLGLAGEGPVRLRSGQVRATRIKINIKGVGQECPTHMGSENDDGE